MDGYLISPGRRPKPPSYHNTIQRRSHGGRGHCEDRSADCRRRARGGLARLLPCRTWYVSMADECKRARQLTAQSRCRQKGDSHRRRPGDGGNAPGSHHQHGGPWWVTPCLIREPFHSAVACLTRGAITRMPPGHWPRARVPGRRDSQPQHGSHEMVP